MFAYCGNNPINYTDETGRAGIWYYLIYKLMMPGFIHMLVEAEIKAKNPDILLESWIRKDGELIGRADLVSKSGDVWEIKHASSNVVGRAMEARNQAYKYMYGEVVRTGTSINRLGSVGAFSGEFTINGPNETYHVTYRTPSNGVVLYYVKTIPHESVATYCLPEKVKSTLPITSSVNKAAEACAIFFPILIGGGAGLGIKYNAMW